MALTEPTAPRTVRWANVIGTVAIKASTTVAAGDPLGYSSGWVPADANATYDAIVFAVGPGEGGETIQIADSICLQGFTLGTVGGAVFLSDTAGDYSETPSTTSSQCIARILAADMIVAKAPDLKYMPTGVKFGYGQQSSGASAAVLHGAGTSALPFISAANGHSFMQYYLESTATGTTSSSGLHIVYHIAGAGGRGYAGRFWVEVEAAQGAGIATCAVLADYKLAAAGSHMGLGAGVKATVGSARDLTGTNCSICLASNFDSGITMAGNEFFIRLQDDGTEKMPRFLDLQALTSGANNALDGTHTTPATCVGYLRVKCGLAAASNGGIPIYNIA